MKHNFYLQIIWIKIRTIFKSKVNLFNKIHQITHYNNNSRYHNRIKIFYNKIKIVKIQLLPIKAQCIINLKIILLYHVFQMHILIHIKIIYKKKIRKVKKVKLNLVFLWLKKTTLKNRQTLSHSSNTLTIKFIRKTLIRIKMFLILAEF